MIHMTNTAAAAVAHEMNKMRGSSAHGMWVVVDPTTGYVSSTLHARPIPQQYLDPTERCVRVTNRRWTPQDVCDL